MGSLNLTLVKTLDEAILNNTNILSRFVHLLRLLYIKTLFTLKGKCILPMTYESKFIK